MAAPLYEPKETMMKLTALDQISVSAVKSDSLRPGETFEVSDTLGAELLAKHPKKFAAAVDSDPAEPGPEPAPAPEEKAEAPHPNKAMPAAPANKAVKGGKKKAGK